MFEHFGMRDVFSTLKRYKKIIIIFVLIVGVLASISAIQKIEKTNNNKDQLSQAQYLSTASYSISPKIKPTEDNLSTYNAIPSQIAAILNADFSKKYVYNKMLEKYKPEEIIDYADLTSGTELNIHILDNIFIAQQYENTMVVQLYVETHNQKFSKELLSIYNEYIMNVYAPGNSNVDIAFIDQVNDNVPISTDVIKILNSDDGKDLSLNSIQSTESASIKKIILKNVFVPVIIMAFFVCVIIFIIALFNPTLNRRTDFFEYDVPVTTELYIRKFKVKGE